MTVDEAEALQRLAATRTRQQTRQVEAQIPEIVALLQRADIAVIVLKGPVTRRRLYASDEIRPVADIDLLVDPKRFRRASAVLRRNGYQRVDRHGHSDTFRSSDERRSDVDLHLTLPFATAHPRNVFATLSRHTTTLDLANVEVPVLDEPAHAVHLAIHGAVNRFDPASRTLDEWRRAHAGCDEANLATARSVATAIGATTIWDLAIRNVDADEDSGGRVDALPLWEVEPRLDSARAAWRAGLPLQVRQRDLQRMVALQLSDATLDVWRRDRGIPALPPGTPRLRRAAAKTRRLFDVSGRAARRLATHRSADR